MKKPALTLVLILIIAASILISGKKDQNYDHDYGITKIILKLPEDYIDHEFQVYNIDKIPNHHLKNFFVDSEIKG